DMPTALGALVGSPPPDAGVATLPPRTGPGAAPLKMTALIAANTRDDKALPTRRGVNRGDGGGKTDFILPQRTMNHGLDLSPIRAASKPGLSNDFRPKSP